MFAALSRASAHSNLQAAADAQADLRAQRAEPQSAGCSRARDLWRGDARRRPAAHRGAGAGAGPRRGLPPIELGRASWSTGSRRRARRPDGIILNAGAYTHTSVAILDALNAAERPVIELHLSNVFRRERFRHHSYVSPAAQGVICGFGAQRLRAGRRGHGGYC